MFRSQALLSEILDDGLRKMCLWSISRVISSRLRKDLMTGKGTSWESRYWKANFQRWEEPDDAIEVDITHTPAEIVSTIIKRQNL